MGVYANMPVCDLRFMTDPEAIKNIDEITNIALLVLPKTGDTAVLSALNSVIKTNIASIVYLDPDDEISTINGCTVITEDNFPENKNNALIINGIAVFDKVEKDISGSIILNGIAVMNEKSKQHFKVNFLALNGIKQYLNFEKSKLFAEEIEVDADMIQYLDDETIIVSGETINIADDVTIEMLKEKKINFFAGETIECSKEIAGYIKATSYAGESIDVR